MLRLLPVLIVAGLFVVVELRADAPPVVADEAAEGEAADKPKQPPIAIEAERPDGRPTATSGLTVPKGETFHLGERKSGPLVVSAKNIGREMVYIIATREKRRELVGKVEPGETVVRAFQEGDGILIRNPSKNRRARLTVEVWGTKNLAMYYVPNDKEPPVPAKADSEPAETEPNEAEPANEAPEASTAGE
ncbi:MAG: hypothetical protein AAGJ46_00550 [Planctomycetota bacterium]